jgi:hypothetical protein
MKQPTVYLKIGGSAIAFEENSKEILETVDWKDGQPDWTNAGVCDYRGGGGQMGFNQLYLALTSAEDNAKLIGYDIERVPYPWGN